MTDISELVQRIKEAAVRAKTATEEYASGHMSASVCYAECEEFNRLTDGPNNILALTDSLETALHDKSEQSRISCELFDEVTRQRLQLSESDAVLEKAQARIAEMDKRIRQQNRNVCELFDDGKALRERIVELEAIRSADEKLVRCKSRYHSEQNYRALAAMFGVTTPNLPPIDEEVRAVKLPGAFKMAGASNALTYYYADEVNAALNSAGIKWESE